ncbi:MAG: aldo/keto reductase, partial [Pseudomonadota bacterium]
LAYSPLASGILSGKYSGGAIPKGSRGDREPNMGRKNDTSLMVADKYVALARAHGLDPSAMAIAFCLTRPFMASAIIGATSLEQLKIAISAADITLSDDVMEGIAAIHKEHPAPF